MEGKNYKTGMGIDEFLLHDIELQGMQASCERYQRMRDYALECLQTHPEEKCADVLSDLMPLLEAVVLKFERHCQ